MNDYNIFEIWSRRIPKFDTKYSIDLFDKLAKKGGGNDEKQNQYGKIFNTFYELYIYCFFLGLYNNERLEIPKQNKTDFSHAIEFWGNKKNRNDRDDFSSLQKSIFVGCFVKTEINILDLEIGKAKPEDIVEQLIKTLEEYTKGGCEILLEALNKNPQIVTINTKFVDMIFNSKD